MRLRTSTQRVSTFFTRGGVISFEMVLYLESLWWVLLTRKQESPHEQQQSLLLSRIITNIVLNDRSLPRAFADSVTGKVE